MLDTLRDGIGIVLALSTKLPARFASLPAQGLRLVPHRRALPTVSTDPRGVARASFA